MSQQNNYELLIQKLDQFTRKYYMNQLIRGSLYTAALLLILFLTMSLAEYNFYFSQAVRKTMFYSFIGISGLALAYWVFQPMMHYFRLGKLISHEQAADIIGQHFTDVKDKLLNVLQLHGQANATSNRELILASIDQKSESIKVVPFKKAIDLSQNRKYLRYALPPFLILLGLLFLNPTLITESTSRLIRNNQYFERPALFKFNVLEQDNLQVVELEDFPITVEIEGDILPAEVFIEIDNYQSRLTKEAPNRFSFKFNQVSKDTRFKLYSTGVESEVYTLEVLERPNMMGFEVELDYPAYTGRKDEKLESIGDLVVPQGTVIDWVFNAQHTDVLDLLFAGTESRTPAERFSDDLFTFRRKAMRDESYKLLLSNVQMTDAYSVNYAIRVIPDLHPSINVESFIDSLDKKVTYFIGDASDDYGLQNLSFHYQIKKADGTELPEEKELLSKPKGKQISYSHSWDIRELGLEPGDQVTYYFQIFDNDQVNGSKVARTNTMVYAKPTVEEYEQMAEENNEEIKDQLEKALEESKEIQQEMKRLREELLQEDDVDWQKKKELEKLLQRQQELQKQMQQAQEAFQENQENQEEFSETQEETQEKQEKLEKLFDELKSEEMEKLMENIQQLLEELEKDDALEMMEEFEMNDEELEKELDRMLEMFKQMEMELQTEKMIQDLEKLAEEQEKLAEETENESKPQEELEKEQEEINEKFDELQEEMDKLEEMNKELENPKEMEDREEEMGEIEENLEQSQEQIEQKENKGASKSQKSASEKMREMAQSMSMEMEGQAMEQMEEDMAALRQLLENLVGLSFEQEDLIAQFGLSSINTPRYVDLVQQQFKLEDDFRLIEDSLQALSKRVFQIESFVMEKVTDIKSNMRTGLQDLEERKKPQAGEHQQRVMKGANDLALMLSEVMNQMQQQMSGMMAGSQMCNKPGGTGPGGKPSDKMSEGQKELNEQMKKMSQGMQNGMKPGSKEFAQMAARQAALRQALEAKQRELQQQGKGSKGLQEMIEEMNKVEVDLVNKRLTNEMLKRQEEILTRLLEDEKAEREREYDNQRKSDTARNYERELPPSLEEYLKKREAEIELYKTVSPSLKPYYKFLVEEYYKSLE
ncbi:MAG: DUF4175 domain-containing protein [Saprospiraceae bacterium]|nr:DUF4175 domain-containing protein [Saprospiraceae bacterium]